MNGLSGTHAKAAVEVAGRSLLGHALHNIASIDARGRAIVVVGHAAHEISTLLAGHHGPLPAQAVFNPDYARAGPLRSIQRGLEEAPAGEDVTIANADTIVTPPALAALRATAAPVALLASTSADGDEDDVQLAIEGDVILRAAKRLGPAGSLPVSAGMLQICGTQALADLRAAVEAGVEAERTGGTPLFWHDILARLQPNQPRAVMVPHDWWHEFDRPAEVAMFEQRPLLACR